MSPMLGWLATYAIHSTLLLGAAAVLTATVVRRETWRETLWKAALVGGVLTASLQLALGVRPLVGRWELADALVSAPAHRATLGTGGNHDLPIPVNREAPGHSLGRAPGPQVGPASERSRPVRPRPAGRPLWPDLVIGVWGATASFGIGRVLQRHVRLRRLLRGRRELANESVAAMLAQLRRRAGVWRLVRLTATSRCSTPFTLGSSEICLPDRLFESLTPEERRSVLAHELAHLARRDPLWQLAAALIEAVFFFQPLNRLAALRLREEAEHIADDWAVRQTGSAVGLVRSLAAVAGWLAPDEGLPQATMAMTEGGSGLLRRVERLLTPRSDAWTPGAGVRGLAAAALLVGTVGVAPGIVGRGAEPKSKETFRGDAVEVTRIRRHPDPEEPLARRFEWAQAQARRHGDRDFWVAYECRSVVPPSWAHGAESQRHTESRARPSPDELMIRSARDRSGPTEAPDLVVLLRTRREPDGRLSVIRVAGGTPSVAIDLEGQAAYWLGSAEEHESIDLLASLGRYAADLRVMETLVEIIALHQDSRAVVPYLSHVLDGDDGTDVRGAAVHGLAWHPSPEVTQRLLDTALDDRSGVVQREAAEALGESGVKEAEAALEQIIASRAARVETRAKAVEALGSFRRPDVLRKLVGIAFGSFDPKMQDEAVEAAADIGLPDVPPVMKRVAFQHPDAKVRGEALERLARAGRRADLETLFRVALGDPDSRNQRLATARLADFDLVDAAPFLKRLAWEHRRSAIRCQAVELVGAMPEALGLPLLDELVKRHPDEAVRRQAMAAIAGYLDEPSARRLLEIARHHPSPATRHQALELLIGGSPVASSAGGGRP